MKISDCINGNPPIFVSHPHFMEGDKKLFENFEGLAPNRSLHNSFVYLHPRFSTPFLGISRMQLNLQVSHFRNYYQKLPEDLILPLAWIETTNSEIPSKFKLLFFLSSNVADWGENLFKYGSIFFLMISILFHCVMNKAKNFKFILISQTE